MPLGTGADEESVKYFRNMRVHHCKSQTALHISSVLMIVLQHILLVKRMFDNHWHCSVPASYLCNVGRSQTKQIHKLLRLRHEVLSKIQLEQACPHVL